MPSSSLEIGTKRIVIHGVPFVIDIDAAGMLMPEDSHYDAIHVRRVDDKYILRRIMRGNRYNAEEIGIPIPESARILEVLEFLAAMGAFVRKINYDEALTSNIVMEQFLLQMIAIGSNITLGYEDAVRREPLKVSEDIFALME